MGSLRIEVISPGGRLAKGVTTDKKCIYCGKKAYIYVWCLKHYSHMQRIKTAIQEWVNNP